MGCPHEFAERVKDLEPLFVGNFEDSPIAVDIYFCPDCDVDFVCKADTFQILSPLSMGTDLHDAASDAGIEVSDGRF